MQPDKKESLVGMMGVEAAYDDVLKGKDGKVVYQKMKINDQFRKYC